MGINFKNVIKACLLVVGFWSSAHTSEISVPDISQLLLHSSPLKVIKPLYNVDKNQNILSLDGGGIRGLIAALMALEFEEKIHNMIGVRLKIGQVFDLIVGTSTGAISAVSLAKPDENDPTLLQYSAQDLVDLYEKEAVTIFERSLWRKLTSVFGLVDEKYSRANLDKLLKGKLGNSKVSEAVTKVCVTSYEITDKGEGSQPVVFRSYNIGEEKASNITAVDAAEASGAAPTYFEPKEITIDDESHYFIDGGMTGQNDPDCRALLEAVALTAEKEKNVPLAEKTQYNDFFVVSMGTGKKPAMYDPQKFKNGGALNLLMPVIEIALDAPSQNNVEMMRLLSIVMQNDNYHRLNPALDKDIKLDDTSPTALQMMKDATKKYIDEHTEEFDTIIKRLVFTTLHKKPDLNPALYALMNVEYQEKMAECLANREEILQAELFATQKLSSQLAAKKRIFQTAGAAEDFTEGLSKLKTAVGTQRKRSWRVNSNVLMEMREEM